jgi:hypothetical protein
MDLRKRLIEALNIHEEIRAQEATNFEGTFKTLANGSRKVGWYTDLNQDQVNTINDIGTIEGIRVKGNKYGTYVFYRKDIEGAKEDALKLKAIAEKYGGYLSSKATDEDSIMIGRLLGYKESDIQDYINRHKK